MRATSSPSRRRCSEGMYSSLTAQTRVLRKGTMTGYWLEGFLGGTPPGGPSGMSPPASLAYQLVQSGEESDRDVHATLRERGGVGCASSITYRKCWRGSPCACA